MKIMHMISSVDLDFGGPSKVVGDLHASLLRRGIGSEVYTVGDSNSKVLQQSGNFIEFPADKGFLGRYFRQSHALIDHILRSADRGTVIHNHGLWHAHNFAAVSVLRKRPDLRFVHSLHGMLLPRARKKAATRKKATWFLRQKAALQRSNAIVVNSAFERLSAFEVLPDCNIVCIPNSVSVRAGQVRPHTERKDVLFMGRLDPIKNLENLLDGWSRSNEFHGRHWLRLVGPSNEKYKQRLLKKSAKLGISNMEILDPVYEYDSKIELLKSVTALILPSFSENFGMVVLEAMSVGTPVIVSDQTPWNTVEDRGVGWLTQTDPDSISRAIKRALTSSSAELDFKGTKAKAWAETEFSPHRVVNKYLDLYKLYSSI